MPTSTRRAIVETFDRGESGWLAVACREGALLESGRVAAAKTEAEAASRALERVYAQGTSDLGERVQQAIREGKPLHVRYRVGPSLAEIYIRPDRVEDGQLFGKDISGWSAAVTVARITDAWF